MAQTPLKIELDTSEVESALERLRVAYLEIQKIAANLKIDSANVTISRLDVREGDVIVAKSDPFPQDHHTADRIRKRMEEMFPGVQVLLLGPEISLSVLKRESSIGVTADSEEDTPEGRVMRGLLMVRTA